MKSAVPTRVELAILKILWQAESAGQAPISVSDIRARLSEAGRELAHTSVITTLNIMHEKGFVRRTKRKNAYFFSPKLRLDALKKTEVSQLLDRVFDGSAENLMLTLLDSHQVDANTIKTIRKMVNKKSKDLDKD